VLAQSGRSDFPYPGIHHIARPGSENISPGSCFFPLEGNERVLRCAARSNEPAALNSWRPRGL